MKWHHDSDAEQKPGADARLRPFYIFEVPCGRGSGLALGGRKNMTASGDGSGETANIRIPAAVCVGGEVLKGSHATLEALFKRAGAPGPPPGLAHHSKWKTWLLRAGDDPSIDSLKILGLVLEEFMDCIIRVWELWAAGGS